MKKNSRLKLISIVITLLLASLACGTNNSGTLVETANSSANSSVNNTGTAEDASPVTNNASNENTSTVEEPTKPSFFSVGDVIEVKDHKISLVSAEIKNGILIASFAVKNEDSSEMSVSSLLSFSARNDAGENLEQEIFDCSPGLDGTIVAGDVLIGNVCWSGAAYPLKVYYDSSLLSSGSTVWELTEDKVSDVSFTPDAIETFSVGDVIEVQDHNITLVETQFTNGRLMATFLVENTGSSEVNVSSLLSFTAKNSDGTKLDQDIFDCGSGLDGTVIVGDKLRGNICWTGASLPVTIYYDSSLFSSGTVVWTVTE